MKYSMEEVLQYVQEEDVKFIRLAFCDVFGKLKNISIMPGELDRAFKDGVSVDASAIAGFGGEVYSDLVLHPDPSTLSLLPWRPEHGRVVRMLCNIAHPDGTPFAMDTRRILMDAVQAAQKQGITFAFGAEMEFYLFKLTEDGECTKIPYDNAGYMDIAPEDKGENVRRDICLTLERMGIRPESSHHEEGPGQNEIDFRYADPLTAADDAVTFRSVVSSISARNGLCADFSAKPLEDCAGNGMHINISAKSSDGQDIMPQVIAGILSHINEITLFLNPTEDSYRRFGNHKAPAYVSWSHRNRTQLIRIPAAKGEYRRAELRSPDPTCNPYIAYALLIWAGLDGVRNRLPLCEPADFNMYALSEDAARAFQRLPATYSEAKQAASCSKFVSDTLPAMLIQSYTD